MKLSIRSDEICSKMNINRKIVGKSVFVGQPIYYACDMSVKQYSVLVNNIIKRFKIDYYLPHTRSSGKETIDCEIWDITKDCLTLEIYAQVFPLKIYSFSSSVLYTVKLLNPQSETYAIVSDKVRMVSQDNIIYRLVDGILKI